MTREDPQDLECPFCGSSDFDRIGLRQHLLHLLPGDNCSEFALPTAPLAPDDVVSEALLAASKVIPDIMGYHLARVAIRAAIEAARNQAKRRQVVDERHEYIGRIPDTPGSAGIATTLSTSG